MQQQCRKGLFFSPDALEITWRRRNLCVGTYEWLRRHVAMSTSGRNLCAQTLALALGARCPLYGQRVPVTWSVDAQHLVPECPFDGHRQTD